MQRNIELKMLYPNPQRAHRVARELGATPHAVERQRDTYFRTRTGRLKLRQAWTQDADMSTVDATQPGRGELLWYRRDDDPHPRPSDYELIPVENAERLRVTLGQALGVTVVVVKTRAVYLHENVRIHIDEVDGLGSFMEFEAIVDAACDDQTARAKVERLSAAFGVMAGDIVAVSYADLVGPG